MFGQVRAPCMPTVLFCSMNFFATVMELVVCGELCAGAYHKFSKLLNFQLLSIVCSQFIFLKCVDLGCFLH